MALKFSVAGKGGLGDILSGWSVTENATPTNVGEGSASTNTASYTGATAAESVLLVDKQATITHVPELPEIPSLGAMTGAVQSSPITGGQTSVTQGTFLSQLNVDRIAQAPVPGAALGVSTVINPDAAGIGLRPVILNTDTDYNNTYFYVLTTDPASGNYLSRFDSHSGALVWRTLVSTANSTWSGLCALDNGLVVVQAADNYVKVVSNTGVVGAALNTMYYGGGTPNFRASMVISCDRNNEVLVWQPYSLAGSGYAGFWSCQLLYVTLDASNNPAVAYRYGGNGGAGLTSSTNVPAVWPAFAQLFPDEQILVYGPAVSGETTAQGWALYSTSGIETNNMVLTKVYDVISPYGGEHGVTSVDNQGKFLIGDHQFNATTGLEVFQWEATTTILNASYPSPNWYVTNVNADGYASYTQTNARSSSVPYNTSVANVRVITRVNLSDVFTYYFSLIFGTAFVHPITWSAGKNPAVVVPGWSGNVWDHVNQLLSAYRLELVILNNVPVIRDVCSVSLAIDELAISPTLTPTSVGNSRTVSLNYYNTRTVSASGRQAFNLENLNTNPKMKSNITGYVPTANSAVNRATGVGPSGTALIVLPKNAGTAGNSTENFAVYGQGVFSGTRFGTTNKRMNLKSGVTYVFRATGFLASGKQTGTLSSRARRIVVRQSSATGTNVKEVVSPAFPNVAGQYFDVEVTATMSPSLVEAALLLYGGGLSSAHGVYWTNIRISVVGQETPDSPDDFYFDGDSPNWYWTGTVGNSTSGRAIPAKPADNLIYNSYDDENNVLSIDVQGRETTTIETKSYPTTLNQPIVTDNLYETRYGYYYISAADNLPVTAAQWAAYGGNVTVAQNKDNPSSIDVTMTGPKSVIPGVEGPFRMAASDGENDYAFFSVTGTGVRTDPQVLVLSTGVNEDSITQDDGGTTDNFAITDLDHAYDVGFELAENAGTASLELEFSVPIARLGSFGTTPGSTFQYQNCNYRVKTCNIGNGMAQITADRYTLADDVAALYDGQTVDQMAAFWTGYTAQDIVLNPLKPLS